MRISLCMTLLLGFAVGCGAPGGGAPASHPSAADAGPVAGAPSDEENGFARNVLTRVNVERQAQNLPALLWDGQLAPVAYAHAKDMQTRHFFAHVNPDGKDPFDRMRDANVSFSSAGENIAQGQQTPAEVMGAWMNSPPHKANILSADFTMLGVGVRMGADGPYWVQEFRRP